MREVRGERGRVCTCTSHTHFMFVCVCVCFYMCAGALDRIETHPGLYSELVFRSQNVKCISFEEIERDLHRSASALSSLEIL